MVPLCTKASLYINLNINKINVCSVQYNLLNGSIQATGIYEAFCLPVSKMHVILETDITETKTQCQR